LLGVQAWRTQTATPTTEQPVDTHAAESGFRLLRRHDLLGLIALTWLFFFLYGPVEDALPVYVAHDLHAHARLLGAYGRALASAPSPQRCSPARSAATRLVASHC
jgi:hypothetical protein